VRDLVRDMSIDQQIGQLLMVGFSGKKATASVLGLIQSGHVGGVILFTRNLGTPQQIIRLTTTLQEAARAAGQPFPLLIATDQENGIVRRTGSGTTSFPGNMALGAIDSEAATEAVARATGDELRALGITLNLAPVVDISNNPANPVIGVRSFGADPELVARQGAAAVRGYLAAEVAATIKHFPGHGDTDVDSHLALPSVPYDIQRLEAVELVPFRRAIGAGAQAVMTAHVAMPAITGSSTLPATLAPDVIRGLLRQRLNFHGVVITDCLEMRAISAGVGIANGAVQALNAGADIVLISHRHDRQMEGLTAIRNAAKQGELPADTLRAAAERVLRLKERLPTWHDFAKPRAINGQTLVEHQRLADDLYARSITIIRDEGELAPLRIREGGRVFVVTLSAPTVNQAADRGFEPAVFVDALQRHLRDSSGEQAIDAQAIALAERPVAEELASLQQRAAAADIVVLATCNAHLPRYRASVQATADVLQQTGRPIIGVAVCDPYDAAVMPAIPTWLTTYDYTPPALEAVARALVGAQSASGVLPVTL
jgi:beta-N-acetylhexosaminidase